MSLSLYMKTESKRFKCPALENALRNLGDLPLQLARVGDKLTKAIRHNLSNRVLMKRTGRLHDSWSWRIAAANRGWIMAVGSDCVYAAIHEFGGWTGRNYATKIPKRRYVSKAVISTKAAVRKLMQNYVTKIFWR